MNLDLIRAISTLPDDDSVLFADWILTGSPNGGLALKNLATDYGMTTAVIKTHLTRIVAEYNRINEDILPVILFKPSPELSAASKVAHKKSESKKRVAIP